MGWLFNRQKPDHAEAEISLTLARQLAAQVGDGLRHNREPRNEQDLRGWHAELEESVFRARRALTTVAIILERATQYDPVVCKRIALSGRARTTGILREAESAPPAPEPPHDA